MKREGTMMRLCSARPTKPRLAESGGWFAAIRRAIGGWRRRSTPRAAAADGGWFVVRDPQTSDLFRPGDVVRLVRAPRRGETTARYQRFPDGLIDDMMPHTLDPSVEPVGYVAGEWPPPGLIHRWPPDLSAS